MLCPLLSTSQSHGDRGERRRRAEQVVAAAVSGSAGGTRPLMGNGFLRQLGQRVVLAEDRDHR
ncbi:MAG: hypothetical protein ACRD44_19050, partial [Bryobacteraceae bacterium]